MACPHYLSACLCFKDSANYLAEWLAFYSVLGVDHFFLYENDSTDDYARVTEPYTRRGKATLVRFPGRGRQQAMYEHCRTTYGPTTRWMMFCDDDEFLFPTADISLPEALQGYERFAGLAVSWMLYGSSGHLTRPPGLVIDSYTRRFALPDQHVKCIVDPAKVVRSKLVGHEFECKAGEFVVNESGEPMTGPFALRPSADRIRINHYLTKSREEMVVRRRSVAVNTGEVSSLSIDEWIKLDAQWNQVEDPIARRYARRVAAAME